MLSWGAMARDFAPIRLLEPATAIIRRLRQAGHEAYIAGGAVRDHLLGREQCDLDIATSARPEEVRALFSRTFAVGEAFGVVVVHLGGRDYEVATFREEAGYRDGRHPDQVRYSSARADVARRDFTINGMMWDPLAGELLDWVGGREDLAVRRIRTIGDPGERFGEDRLRLLRAVRFAAQLDFRIDPATLQAIRDQAQQLPVVSLERVRLELDKLLAAPAARQGLDLLRESGLWPVLREWLRREAQAAQTPQPFSLGDVDDAGWRHAWQQMAPLAPAAAEPAAAWFGLLALLLDVAGHPTELLVPAEAQRMARSLDALMRVLRGSRADMAGAAAAARILCHLPSFTSLRLADQLRLLRRPEATGCRALAAGHPDLAGLDVAGMAELCRQYQERWHAPLLLGGTDLQALGCHPGPKLGRLLHDLESMQLEGRLADVREARRWVADRLLE